jgi:hypothetical protein
MGATDSKLAFRKTVFRLYEDKDIPTNKDEFWSSVIETISYDIVLGVLTVYDN